MVRGGVQRKGRGMAGIDGLVTHHTSDCPTTEDERKTGNYRKVGELTDEQLEAVLACPWYGHDGARLMFKSRCS